MSGELRYLVVKESIEAIASMEVLPCSNTVPLVLSVNHQSREKVVVSVNPETCH